MRQQNDGKERAKTVCCIREETQMFGHRRTHEIHSLNYSLFDSDALHSHSHAQIACHKIELVCAMWCHNLSRSWNCLTTVVHLNDDRRLNRYWIVDSHLTDVFVFVGIDGFWKPFIFLSLLWKENWVDIFADGFRRQYRFHIAISVAGTGWKYYRRPWKQSKQSQICIKRPSSQHRHFSSNQDFVSIKSFSILRHR